MANLPSSCCSWCWFPTPSLAASPLKVHFNALWKKPRQFLWPPHYPRTYMLLISSVSPTGCLLSLHWQTATFNSEWWLIYALTKIPLVSSCNHRDLTSKGCGRTAFNRLQGMAGVCFHILIFLPHLRPEFDRLGSFPGMEAKERLLPLISISCFLHQ